MPGWWKAGSDQWGWASRWTMPSCRSTVLLKMLHMEAKPIFVDAITAMSIQDAIGIVKGEDNAATEYLRNSTSAELIKKFQPVISKSLDRVQATRYWADVINTYNKIPFVQKVNPDLTAYVTGMAIDGLFIMISKEEKKIRKDPLARTSELLRKVFGN